MSLVLAVVFLSLGLILYRLLYRTARDPNPMRWVQHWLVGDMLVCAITGMFAFGLLYLAKTVADVRAAAVGIDDSAIAAVIAALTWLVLDRLSLRRRARRMPAGPVAGGPAAAA